jgi:hypothetical protein
MISVLMSSTRFVIIFFWWLMKIKKSALIILSMAVRWLGLALGGTGMVWGGWFLFFSYDNYRFAWGLYFLLQTYVGFLIFRYGMKKMMNEFDNH